MKKIATIVQATLFAAGIASAANLSGVVIDSETKKALPGVKITVEEAGKTTQTNTTGQFVLVDAPDKKVKITFEYLGYEAFTREVNLKEDRSGFKVELTSQVKKLKKTHVRPQLDGQSRALNQQKNADNIKNVIAADQIGRFPDQNVAEAVQRAPGISVARDQGEGRYIQIRGTSPRLTAVKINGMEIPAPEGDTRSAAMDVIPANQLASVEISKAITPEMDADAIGGMVNLEMKKATNKEPEIDVSLAGGFNQELNSTKNFEGLVNYGQRFGENEELGVVVGAGYLTRHFGSDNIEADFGDLLQLDASEEETGDETEAYKEIDMRDYEITRTRTAANLNLDYRLGAGSELWLNSTINRFADDELRRRTTLKFEDGKHLASNTDEVQDVEVAKEMKDRYEVQDIFMVSGGGKHLLGDVILDYSGSYSHAQEDEPDRQDTEFVGNHTLVTPDKRSSTPRIEFINDGDNFNNAANYEFNEAVVENNLSTDQNIIAQFNLEIPVPASFDWVIKTGAKARFKEKDRNNKAEAFEWSEDAGDAPTLDGYGSIFNDDDFFNGEYPNPGIVPSEQGARDFLEDNQANLESEVDLEDSNLNDFVATEDVYAAYIQTRAEMGKIMILTGARFERTDLRYQGYAVNADTETISAVSKTSEYDNILPSLHLRYAFDKNTNIRVAGTQSIARPNYFDLVPYSYEEDEEISRGNPNLQPSKSSNFDLMFAHYFQSVGIISAGYYYKYIEDVIFTSVYEEGDFEVSTKDNAAWGELHGLEFAWNQQFTSLPGALSGLGLYSNYNYASSAAVVPVTGRFIDLPGQAEHMANIALSFEQWGFSSRLSLNYHSDYLAEVGDEADSDVYYVATTRLDWSLQQQLATNVMIFAEATNLTNAPLKYYEGSESNVIQQEYYGISSKVGFKYSF